MSAKKYFLISSLIIIITIICGPAMAATQAQINGAIENGVAWLAAQQTLPAGYWQDGSNRAAPTGLALIKLQERAFELGYTPFDPCYPYKEAVEKGLAYLFITMRTISISSQPAGNPDTDGDGIGVYVNAGHPTYDTGIALMAIAVGQDPNRVVNSPGSPVNGWTYKQVLVDMVDYMAFGQCDSSWERGGWRYTHNEGTADNSNSGYAVLGLGYAEALAYGFNCAIPQFVKDELKIWIDYIQMDGGSDDGGSGYSSPGYLVNILKTGNLVFQMTFAGMAPQDPNIQRALAYIGRKWNDSSQSPGWGNPAYGGIPHGQAMFSVMRGLEYAGIDTIVVNGSPRDWYADFADAIVNRQQTSGNWPNDPYGGTVLATEWALLTLEKSAPIRIPTLEKDDSIGDGNCVGPGDEIAYTICYSYSDEPFLSDIYDVNIIDYLPVEVEPSNPSDPNYNPSDHTYTWNIGTLHPGDAGCVTLTVEVVEVNECVEPGGTITNCCAIKSGDQSLNTSYKHTAVCCPTLTKEDNVPDGNCVGPGDNITYSICYDANGYDDTNVVITDNLSNDLEFVSATGNYEHISGTITWDIGTLGSNDSNCVTVTVQVKCPQPRNTISNSCELRGDCITPIYAEEATFVCSSPTLTKVDNVNHCVGPEDIVTYSICYAANGYGDTNVVITDTLPTGVDFVSATGNYEYSSGTVTWNIGTLGPDDSNCFTVTVQVKCPQPGGTITNHCEMIGGCINLFADENTTVCSPTLTKVDNITGCVGPGSNITYSICYAAHGYGDTNVVITDVLPDEVNYVPSDDGGSYNPGNRTVTWDIGTLGPNESGCVGLVVQVNAMAESLGTITNCCTMTGDCLDINACEYTPVCCWPVRIIYVDAEATGGNNGSSWGNAYKYLQDALTDASIDPGCEEIWAAEGTYKPDRNSANPNGTGNRAATFQLINGVAVYGGFPLGGGTLQDRKPAVYETILSGDLLENDSEVAEPCDLFNDPNRADNSYHVVTGSGTTQTTILDGFTITAGDANGPSDSGRSGGGMYIDYGSPTVKNCKFIRNSAQFGGGMYIAIYDANITVTNCTFIENSAYGDNYGVFLSYGGGIYISNSYPYVAKVTSCIFAGNSGSSGGGICNTGTDTGTGNLTVTNCTFSENLALGGCGISGSGANITNCTFVANAANYYGYGSGGAIDAYDSNVTNCILWGNEGGQISGDVNVTYSDIQGNWPGVGNINKDPMFEADGYHLKMCSPCVDTGTNTPAGGLPATDIDGQDRIMNGRCAGEAIVDMGADEYYLEDCNALLYAHCRKPACDEVAGLYVGEAPNVNLEWSPGLLAADVNGHDVYFGTSYSGVYNATILTPIIYKSPRRSEPHYLAVGLNAGVTYYWRIDEVNDTNIWRGPVYSFRTGLFIDDFERYNSTDDVNANWPDGYLLTGCGGCQGLATGNSGRLLVQDGTGKYMRYHYDNSGTLVDPYGQVIRFSEAKRPYSGPGVSFTGGDANTLRVDYLGSPTNAVEPTYDRMYVAIEDTAGNVSVYDNPDPDAALATSWTSWYSNLYDINALGVPAPVKLKAISGFAIGFGVRCLCYEMLPGGEGDVMFDNIQLEPPYTPQSRQLTADFTCDCIVNFADFAIMGQEWLTSGIKADIYKDENNLVDLMDLKVLAEEWLK